MQVIWKTVVFCPVVRWIGASLSEGPAVGGEVRAFGKDLLSVERLEPLGRTC